MDPINKDRLPAPGIYVLSRDLTNPNSDKRKRGDFSKDEFWKAGTRLLVNRYDSDGGYPRVVVSHVGKYYWYGIVLNLYPKSEEFDGKKHVAAVNLLLEPGVLVREEDSIQSVMLVNGDGDHYNPILKKLFEAGKITIEDVIAAMNALNEEWNRGGEVART